jgi:Histidine kinase-, DNA gyrase B-, and HSP90-like ATPase
VQLGAAKEVLNRGDNKGLSYLERAAELAQFGLAEARRSAFSLQPSLTEGSGLIEALQKLVERSNVPGRLRCNFHASNVPEERLPPMARHELLRIAQEAISNAVRHAKPTVISVSVRSEAPNLVIEVTDNGSGIAEPQLDSGGWFWTFQYAGPGGKPGGPIRGSNGGGSRHQHHRALTASLRGPSTTGFGRAPGTHSDRRWTATFEVAGRCDDCPRSTGPLPRASMCGVSFSSTCLALTL